MALWHTRSLYSLILLGVLHSGVVRGWVAEPPTPRTSQHGPLPAFLTKEEALLPLPAVTGERLVPTGYVRTPAEYEPNEGLLFSWVSTFDTVLTNIIVYTTTGNPGGHAWVLVPSAATQLTATNKLSAAGANMARVEFIIRSQNSVWIRDYGPRFIQQEGTRAIVDHTYNRPRPLDNGLPTYLAAAWGEMRYALPLVHGGGNFHLFSNGDAYLTGLILNENSGVSSNEVLTYFGDYEGLDVTIVEPFPSSVDATQHIDMWFLPIGDNRVIINEYAGADTYAPRRITNETANTLASHGYEVHRVPAWNSGNGGVGGTHYTYTNAIIINDQVLIPWYNDPRDAQALAVFEAALPDKTIRQIDCRQMINYAGALHCVVMHVPELILPAAPQVRITSPRPGDLLLGGETRVITWTAYDQNTVSHVDIWLSTDGGATFPYVVAEQLPDTGWFAWIVPRVAAEDCRLLIAAHDPLGNVGTNVTRRGFRIAPRTPEQVYAFWLDMDPGWARTGQWQFGTPLGQGGSSNGFPDPTSGFSGNKVFGVNLAGDYATTPGGPYYLTTEPLDLRGIINPTLRFQRWLNTDQRPYVEATVELSIDYTNWTILWSNGTSAVTANQWASVTYALPDWAAQQPTVYLRWSYRVNSSAWAFSGWNIDDIEVWGIPAMTPFRCHGDMNCDGFVTFADIGLFIAALKAGGPGNWPAPDPPNGICPYENGDFTGDEQVTFADISGFIAALKIADPVPCVTTP